MVSGRSNPVQISRFYLVLVFFCSSLARCCVFKNSFVENFQNFLLGVNFFPKNFPGKCFVCCFAINRRLLLLEFVSIGSRISFPPVSRSLCEFLSSLAPSLSHVFFPSESTKMKKRGSPLLQNEKLDSMAPRVVKKWKNSLWTKRLSARIKKRAKVMLLLIFTKPNDRLNVRQ